MDSPLTAAEISRLRKAINQRERMMSQGLSAGTAESNIVRALSNLKLYLPQSQLQLVAILKDWAVADLAKKSQIIIWLRQNVLGEQEIEARISTPTPIPLSQSPTPRPKFVAPPPPPPLPTKTQSLPPQIQSASCPQIQEATVSTITMPTRNASPRPLPTPSHSHLGHSASFGHSQVRSTPTPPMRELHTQAVHKPPTPPPKDRQHLRSHSIRRSSGQMTVEQLTLGAQGLKISQPVNEAQLGLSAIPVASAPPSHSNPPSPLNGIRPSGVPYTTRSQDSGRDTRASQYLQTESTPPYSYDQTHHVHAFPTRPPVAESQPNPTTQLPNTPAARPQRQQSFLAQFAQSSAKHTTQLLEAMKKYQTYSAQSQPQSQSQPQVTYQPTGGSGGGDPLAQFLTAYQQQQQQQTNQMIAALQQQSTPAFDPVQILAQSQQQDQDFANMLAQMQANSSSPVFDPAQSTDYANMLAQMQANTPGLDVNSFMSGGGGGPGIDWTSVAGASGIDPTSMAMAMAMQGSGLF